jgi:hypothetical protein
MILFNLSITKTAEENVEDLKKLEVLVKTIYYKGENKF